MSVTHYRAIHQHLFQDVYTWAGQVRRVRIAKGGSMFAYPEHLPAGLRTLFGDLGRARFLRGLTPEAFATQAAHVLAELNALHPFRDGNGRTQLIFLALLADQAGHPLDLIQLDPACFLAAMVASFQGNEGLLSYKTASSGFRRSRCMSAAPTDGSTIPGHIHGRLADLACQAA